MPGPPGGARPTSGSAVAGRAGRRHRRRSRRGRCRSAGCGCSCSTPTSRGTRTSTAPSPGSSTAGTTDTRLRQELVLGVGGVRLLAALGIAPGVYHLNEGHAAFAALERLRVHLAAGADLDAAVARVRSRAGVHHPHTGARRPRRVRPRRRRLAPGAAGRARRRRVRPTLPLAADRDGRWSQTVLAVRTSRSTNGVARLHGEVSRRMLAPVFGVDLAPEQVPVGHVTNGVHPGRWVGPELARLYDWHLGDGWRTTRRPRQVAGHLRGRPGRAVAGTHRCASPADHRRAAPAGGAGAPDRGGSRRPGARSGGPHDRLRTPVRDLQAGDAVGHRPRPARRPRR